MTKKLPKPKLAVDNTTDEPPFDQVEKPDELQLGQWYWVNTVAEWRDSTDEFGNPVKKGQKYRWLGCVMQIGSNYVLIESPPYDHSRSSIRIHFDEFDEYLTFAPDADQYIAERQLATKQRLNALLAEVKEVTAKLGIVPTQQIAEHSGEGHNALAVVSNQPDTKAYKKALIKASEKTLPDLFEKIKDSNKELARWMTAPTLPLSATISPMEGTIAAVKDRIYTIELYAGLTEDAIKCCDGAPAERDEKLRVMQRRLYMDEECLANYEAGGMEFKDIAKFDEWISKQENRDRILPFPRTLVAFRVRRERKYREDDGNIRRMYINFYLEQSDKTTFLYVRNGEQVWRVNCDFEFDEMIVPNKDDFNPAEPMMVKMFATSVDAFMPKKRWESLAEVYAKHEEWMEEWDGKPKGPGHKYWRGDSPYYAEVGNFSPRDWKPFDPTNVYYDDALKEMGEQIKKYNRIAVIIQGLFDRSEALHPHMPVRMWEAENFERAVELIYDAVTLTYGEKPDFEAFRAELNATISGDSVLTGQEDFWERREAERENNRIANNYNYRGTPPNYKRFSPHGDDGPGLVGVPVEWKPRVRKAVFRWKRQSRDYRRYRDMLDSSIEVPVDELLNVSAYKPGDFKKFFSDPRTRREYLQWAPLLLAAEDWHAGKIKRKK